MVVQCTGVVRPRNRPLRDADVRDANADVRGYNEKARTSHRDTAEMHSSNHSMNRREQEIKYKNSEL